MPKRTRDTSDKGKKTKKRPRPIQTTGLDPGPSVIAETPRSTKTSASSRAPTVLLTGRSSASSVPASFGMPTPRSHISSGISVIGESPQGTPKTPSVTKGRKGKGKAPLRRTRHTPLKARSREAKYRRSHDITVRESRAEARRIENARLFKKARAELIISLNKLQNHFVAIWNTDNGINDAMWWTIYDRQPFRATSSSTPTRQTRRAILSRLEHIDHNMRAFCELAKEICSRIRKQYYRSMRSYLDM